MAGSNKLQISYNKSLKLTNVLCKEFKLDNVDEYQIAVNQMENYIKSKGMQPIGPLIQYTSLKCDGDEDASLLLKIMRQASSYISRVEAPYSMESVIRIPDCLYVRFTAEEDKMRFAYDKLNLISFEEDIPLIGDSYTIFVDKNEDILVADVFMEKAKNG